jgi:hypothetical protein
MHEERRKKKEEKVIKRRKTVQRSPGSSAPRGNFGTGMWHRISAKHLQAYCDEMCFRFNNRKNPYLFRDTIIKLIGFPNVEYKQLTSKETA